METFHRLHRVQLYASPETARLASEAYGAAWRWGHLSRRGRDDEAFYDSQDAYDTAWGLRDSATSRPAGGRRARRVGVGARASGDRVPPLRSPLRTMPSPDEWDENSLVEDADELAERFDLPVAGAFTDWYGALRVAARGGGPGTAAAYRAAGRLTGTGVAGLEHGILPLSLFSVGRPGALAPACRCRAQNSGTTVG